MTSHLELSFVTEDTLGSAAIRWFTHSNYSHVDIITPDGHRIGARTDHPVYSLQPLGEDIAHAGVQKRPMDYAPFTRDDRLIIPCSGMKFDLAYSWLNEQLGKPYDRGGLFASFLLDRTDWRHDGQWWCSELGTVFIEKAGFPVCRTPANRMSPNDCYIYAGCFASMA